MARQRRAIGGVGMSRLSSKAVGAVVALLVVGAMGVWATHVVRADDDVRRLEWQGTSVDVPLTWPERNPSQWCRGRGDPGPSWFLPGPTTLVGCEPFTTGYGVTFRPDLPDEQLHEEHSYGGDYPPRAWVAVVRPDVEQDYGVLVVMENREDAEQIIATIE
jgi:hypothetical protein